MLPGRTEFSVSVRSSKASPPPARSPSGEPELLAGRGGLGQVHRPFEYVGTEKGPHESFVELVAEQLGFEADGRRVSGGVGRPLAGKPPLEDPLGRPGVDGVSPDRSTVW